jgi:hypothetical protein
MRDQRLDILLSDSRVFINHKPGLRLESVLVEMKEDAELLDPAI